MIGETVERLRDEPTGETDRYGRPVVASTSTPIRRCAFAPAGSVEVDEVGRRTVTTTDTVYAPAGTDVVESDRLLVRGVVREVDGKPADWVNPYDGRSRGLVVRLKVVEG